MPRSLNALLACLILCGGLLVSQARGADILGDVEVEAKLRAFFIRVYSDQELENRLAAANEAETYLASVKSRFGRTAFMYDFYLGQVRMYQGQAQMTVWELEPSKTKARDDAKALYKEAISILERVVQAVVGKMESIEGSGRSSRRTPAIYSEYEKLLSRIHYHIGWTFYRLSETLTKAEKESALDSALSYFRLLVGDKIGSDSDLRNAFVADCFAGMGLVMAAKGMNKEVLDLLDKVTSREADRNVWPQIVLLKVDALMALNRFGDVYTVAERTAFATNLVATPTSIDLQIQLRVLEALVEGTHRMRNLRDSLSRKAAALALGLAGRGEPWRSTALATLERAEGGAITSVKQILELEDKFRDADYAGVSAGAVKLLETLDEKTQPELGVRCRFLAGAAMVGSGEVEKGLPHLTWIIKNAPEHELAASAAATCVTAQWKTVEANPTDDNVKTLFDMIDQVKKLNPNHAILGRTSWFKGAAFARQDKFAEALAQLGAVKRADPDFASATLMTANLSIRAARIEKQQQGALEYLNKAVEALKVLEAFVADPGEAGETIDIADLTRICSTTWVALAEEFLRAPAAKPDAAFAALKDFEKRFPKAGEMRGRILTLEIEALMGTGKTDMAVKAVQKLMSDKESSQEGLGVVIRLANHMEADISKLSDLGQLPEAEKRALALVELYESLEDYYESEGRSGSPEARTVMIRMARALELAREYEDAKDVYQEMLDNLAASEGKAEDQGLRMLITRGLALLDEAVGDEAKRNKDTDKALTSWGVARQQWRVLSKSVAPRSEDWYEARYHLILTHYKIGNEAGELDGARKVMRYFELSNPSLGGGHWAPMFKELRDKMGKE